MPRPRTRVAWSLWEAIRIACCLLIGLALGWLALPWYLALLIACACSVGIAFLSLRWFWKEHRDA